MKKVVIVGAGFGGLTVAAELSRTGYDVTVLEAHVYPGGCAGTFYHQGYRFDAGATLAGGFAPGAPMDRLADHFGIDWEAHPVERAMQVHLPDRTKITRWTDKSRWKSERISVFGDEAETFWHWQERVADTIWDLAMRLPAWPPQSMMDLSALTQAGFGWIQKANGRSSTHELLSLSADALRPITRHIPVQNGILRQFIDGQLLISAQTTAVSANSLYGAVALDLARQGVVHLPGGMGGMADKFVRTIHRYGGQVRFRQEVIRVVQRSNSSFYIETKQKEVFPAEIVIFNLPPWNIAQLLEHPLPVRLRRLPERPQDGWGAFMVYVGLKEDLIPAHLDLHHQVIAREPLGEGNSIFMSFSPGWDESRAPHGKRALTISTHTALDAWWHLHENDQEAYQARKAEYTERTLQVAEQVLPGIQNAAELILPGTPVAFQRFTRRAWGWVGGFPQTNLFRAWAPRLAKNLWMVGDTIFPGQSVPAVALGGMRVAQAVTRETERVTGSSHYLSKLQPKRVGQ